MPTRKVVVGIVYYKQDRRIDFLVLHRVWIWRGWEFPKGGVEKGELEEDALRREIMEETGLERVRIMEKLPFEVSYRYTKKYSKDFKYTDTRQSVFLVRTFDPDVKLSAKGAKIDAGGARQATDHDTFEWLPYKDARKKLTHSNYKKALDIAWAQLQIAKE